MKKLLALLVVVWIGMPVTGSGQALESTQGVVAAKRYGPVPRGRPVAIEIRSFEDQSEELETAIAQTLRDQGFTVADKSPLVLFIDTNATAAGEIRPATRAGRPGLISRDRSLRKGEDEGQLPVGIPYDTRTGDNVAVPFSLSGRMPSRGLRYRVTATLSERGKTPLWTGSATAIVSGGNRESIFAALGREITANVGESVKSTSIDITEAGGIVR